MEKRVPLNIAYDVYEAAKGSNSKSTPIILLHGLASDRKTWRDIAPILAEKTKRKVYAYDARNFGDTDYTDEYSHSLNVDDLFHFMNTVNMQKAVLFGHSMGAYTTANAALWKPERVEMMISEDTYIKPGTDQLINACGDYLVDLSHAISKLPCTVDEREATKIVVDTMFEELSEENKKWTPKDILYQLHCPFRRDSEGRYMANFNVKGLFKASRQPHTMQLDPVGWYEGPAIFLCGTKSILDVMSHKSHIRGHFPNAEFIEFEGGYHNVHTLFKEETVDAVVQALRKYNVP